MNWVLIVILLSSEGMTNATTSQQIGPYRTSSDCERAYVVMKGQREGLIREHYCVPVPFTYDGPNRNRANPLPEEFD